MIEVKIEELEMKAVVGKLTQSADRLVRTTAFKVLYLARRNSPVRTGNLKNSIQFRDTYQGDMVAEVIVSANYGAYVEEGTSRSRKKPYLRPAFESVIGYFTEQVKLLLKENSE
jgi:HK97 gp10 family phage protein